MDKKLKLELSKAHFKCAYSPSIQLIEELDAIFKKHYLKTINDNYGGFILVVDGKKQKMFTEDQIKGAL